MVYGFVELLYLASDHVHLYVDSDVDEGHLNGWQGLIWDMSDDMID